MWGPSLIGYGTYDYTYKSGRTGQFLATGFGPRNANLALYIVPGYTDFAPLMARQGKHKKGKACLYVYKADVDLDVVAELVQAGLDDLGKRWPVSGS